MSARRGHRSLWVAGGLGALFALLTWNVVAGVGLVGLDDDVERLVVDHRVAWVTGVLKVLTWLGSSIVLWPVVAMAALLLILRGRRRREALFLIIALGGSIALSDLVKAIVDRPRPSPSILMVHVTGRAYPSGHAMDVTAVFVALALVLATGRSARTRAWITAAAACAILVVGWSRVYLGAHWLTDVLGGYLLAGSWVALLAAVLLIPRVARARTGPYRSAPGR
jgi:undecaprenyl-diphosphatase